MVTRHYKLTCPICKSQFDDDGFILECATRHAPALLVTDYPARLLTCEENVEGIYRYQAWLPVVRTLCNAGKTITYQSELLSRILGLPNLWIAFNGYWPEKGATLETATFKELEAFSVLSRFPTEHNRVLVLASAGNTGTAFAWRCSQIKFPCLLIVPENGLKRMLFADQLDPCVKIVSLGGSADYHDAITLAQHLSQQPGFFPEGGAKNVARRDGLGTTMLNAVEKIGRLPDYYFQAIGSGTGGIAAYEAAQRLIGDGRFGQLMPRLMLSQNFPFTPIYQSWQTRQRDLIKLSSDEGKKQIQQIAAQVLSNQHPPYAIKGGVFDVLDASQGNMFSATNQEVYHARALFEATEGIDIDPAAGVAFASLFQALASGQVDRNALVLLHITGGGWYRRQVEHKLVRSESVLHIDGYRAMTDEMVNEVLDLFQ